MRCCGVGGGEVEGFLFFKDTLNKDNFENGLQHTAASVRTHPTEKHSTPQGCSAHVCFDLAPKIGERKGGRRGEERRGSLY